MITPESVAYWTSLLPDTKKNPRFMSLREHLVKGVALVNEGVAAGSIRNVVYNDAKMYLSRAIEYAIRAIQDAARSQTTERSELTHQVDDLAFMVTPFTAAKRLERMTKLGSFAEGTYAANILRLLTEIAPVAVALESLKAVRVKGRAPNPDAVPAFVPGRAASAVLTRINALLIDQTNSVKEGFIAQVVASETAIIAAFLIRHAADHTVQPSLMENQILFTSSLVAKQENFHREYVMEGGYRRLKTLYDFTLHADYPVRIEQSARDYADFIQQKFVTKNSAKLGKIIEQKGNFKTAQTLRVTLSQAIEALMSVEFEDGSSFQVLNKIVTKYTQRGVRFSQFPTTFHAVVMADGTAMTRPSEERMNTVFSKPAC